MIVITETTSLETLVQKNEISLISLPFNKEMQHKPFKKSTEFAEYLDKLEFILKKIVDNTDLDGGVFIYGQPYLLALIAETDTISTLKFKNWIALDVSTENNNYLTENHMGLLYLEMPKTKKAIINPKEDRVPYTLCKDCRLNTKDWGGKKHLLNKQGSALSDVWRDFYYQIGDKEDPQVPNLKLIDIDEMKIDINNIEDMPEKVVERIKKLVGDRKTTSYKLSVDFLNNAPENQPTPKNKNESITSINESTEEFKSQIVNGDSIEIMRELVKKYPDGVFDLIFADPPYNLDKKYDNYDDSETSNDYLKWCQEWIELCVKLLKKDGHLFLLNIPKWSISYYNMIVDKVYFHDWIVWDALSMPNGKLMPAHYSLLHFSNNEEKLVLDKSEQALFGKAINNCTRQKCVNTNNRMRTNVGQIWSDVFRIKHRRDRDEHPCQLPDSLMTRIISLFSKKGDLVFDPFCGAGTTPVNAYLLEREYFSIDLSAQYYEITVNKLNSLKQNGILEKNSIERNKHKYSKKEIQIFIQKVIKDNGKESLNMKSMSKYINDYKMDFNINDIIEIFGSIESAIQSTN